MTTKVEKTTTNDGNIITTTTTATTEEVIDDEPEKLDFDFDPSKQLNEALEKQRQEERDAFQNLIQVANRVPSRSSLLLVYIS